MDFSLSTEQIEAAALAARILGDTCTNDVHKEVAAANEGNYSEKVWSALATAGLIGLSLPEQYGGNDLGFAETCSVLIEVGRKVAPVPLATHVVAALAVHRFGSPDQQTAILAAAGAGTILLTCATAEPLAESPINPTVLATPVETGWVLSGTCTNVVAGPRADHFVIPATTPEGVALFLVGAAELGPVAPQYLSDGDVVGLIDLDGLALSSENVLGDTDGVAFNWLRNHLTVAACAQQLGVLEGALELTASYAKTREQFGRPIGTFQAVSQRLADGYIDNLGARLCLWQAVWRLTEGLDADQAVAVAKLWAADAGHRLAHTTVHVHGGVGIDLDGEAHRYFTAAKRNEFWMGGATDQARRIGAILAS